MLYNDFIVFLLMKHVLRPFAKKNLMCLIVKTGKFSHSSAHKRSYNIYSIQEND
jgi:hypothetical protein